MTLCYDGTNVRLHGYVDSDFAGNDSQGVSLVISSLWEVEL